MIMSSVDYEIREFTAYDEQVILSLYNSVNWTAYTDDPESLKAGFDNSLLILAACKDDELLGLIRAVGDGQTIVYIQDILVFPEYQRQGIGTALVKAVLDRFCDIRQIVLSTDNTPKTIAFYESLGFYQLEHIGCCGFMRLKMND